MLNLCFLRQSNSKVRKKKEKQINSENITNIIWHIKNLHLRIVNFFFGLLIVSKLLLIVALC